LPLSLWLSFELEEPDCLLAVLQFLRPVTTPTAWKEPPSSYHQVDLSRISFKGTLDTLHHFADAIRAVAAKPRIQTELYSEKLRVIALDQLPIRPHRSEPHAKKRRPKNYHLSYSLGRPPFRPRARAAFPFRTPSPGDDPVTSCSRSRIQSRVERLHE
jgi:hypothetical protein